ncbi:MAG: OsmC family protein [Gammaproteobacteria bacterium]|nr:MAG: OsmC family protein [Gammaproteobacteria bacterium]
MAQPAEQHIEVNGVDVTALTGIIDNISKDATLGKTQFRATNLWLGGAHNRSTIKDFYAAGGEDTLRTATFVYDNNEPALLLGGDTDVNPAEYLLHALAGCLTTTLVYHAAARGIRIEQLESRLEGDLDLRGLLGIADDVRPGYQSIRANFKVKADAPAEELEALLKYSVVCDTVCRPVQVETKVEKVD